MKKLTVFLIVLWIVPLLLLAAEIDTTRRAVQLELPLVPKTVAGPLKARTSLVWHTGPQVFYRSQAVSPPGKVNEPLAQKNVGSYTPIVSVPQSQEQPFTQKVVGQYAPIVSVPQSSINPPPQKLLGQYASIGTSPGPTPTLPPNYAVPFVNVGPVPVGVRSQYLEVTFSDWRGGLNLSDFPENLADNQALEMVNFIWSPTGKLRPRPGFKFRKDKSALFGGAKKLFGLYNYHAPNNRNVVLTAISDTLYADTNETGTYVAIKTLTDNSKYYDFATFKGRAVVIHEADTPFILNQSCEETMEFGLADSFEWSEADKSADGCTLTYTAAEDWQTDQWAGYLLSDNKYPHQSGADEVPLVIHSNTQTTVTVLTYSAHLNYWHKGYIFGLFYYDTVQAGLESQGITGTPCTTSIYNSGDVFDTSMAGKAIVAKFYMGDAAGQERIVLDVPDTHHLDVQYPFDPQPANGDSFNLLQKVFYQPALVEVFKNRLFFAKIENYENLVVFSSYNNLGDFDPDNTFVVGTQDGDRIVALATFFDDQLGYKDESRDCLVIFKENSTWKLVWNSATDYALVLVSPNVGCSAKNSIANVEGKYLLFLHRTGVYAYDGRTVQPISGLIDPLVKSIARSPYLDGAAATYYDNHYYLSYRDSSDTYNDQCVAYNTLLGGWTEIDNLRTWLFANRVSRTDSTAVLFVDGRDRTLIYEFDNRFTADTTAAISLSLKSKAFDFNSLQDDKVFSYFDLDYYLASGSLDVAFYTDFGNTLKYDTTVTQAGGYKTVRLPLASDCIGRNLSFKISSSSALELGKASLEYKKLED